jgi:hypothetical protein
MNQGTGDDSQEIEIAERLAHEFSDLNILIRQLIKEQNQGTAQNTNTQTLHLDAGNKMLWLAVWIATICCVYMLGTTARMDDKVAEMQSSQLEQARKLEADADRLSIILQWAPSLRDEVNREMERKKGK